MPRFFVCISFISFVFLMLQLFIVSPALSQGNYSLSLSQTFITLNQNEGTNLNATFLLDSSPVENAFFEIRDQNGELFFDIAETQISLGGGLYVIILNENQTSSIIPGSYNLKFVGIAGEEETETDLSVTIISIDPIAPSLNILNPTFGPDFNLTIFKLIVEVEDDIGWFDISISVGDFTILYLKNPGVISDSSSRTYNETHLYLEEWVRLIDITGASNSQFTIVARDVGLNEAAFQLLLEGDYTKPIVQFTSHTENERIFSREITLEWTIEDESSIKSQILKLNGIIFRPADRSIRVSDRSFSFNLPIREDQAQFLTFELTVTDIFDNAESVSVTLIFDTTEAIGASSRFQDIDLITIIIGVVLISALITGAAFVYVKLEESDLDDKVETPEKKVEIKGKKWKGTLFPPPLMQLLELLVKQNPKDYLQTVETFFNIENSWNEFVESIMDRKFGNDQELIFELDNFIGEATFVLNTDLQINFEYYSGYDDIFKEWKRRIVEKPKKWKRKIPSPPPLDELSVLFPVHQFRDYGGFYNSLEGLMETWIIIELFLTNQPVLTHNDVTLKLNDFKYELSILLLTDGNLTNAQLAQVTTELDNWINSFF